MHLGNVAAALLSWLSAKSQGGTWLLRIEDLDPQRSRPDFARLIEDDLHWLGLDWDEGGIDADGPSGPYCQSLRTDFYEQTLRRLRDMGLTYSCRCTRAAIMATQAPHESDGRIVYPGTCRPEGFPEKRNYDLSEGAAVRLYVPDRDIEFTDRWCGTQRINPALHCGDFVLRRADGAWAYQLAVVADDAAMGVTEVVRGADLLLSAAQQTYLYELLGHPSPEYAHFPLMLNDEGRRLSKRNAALGMDRLRHDHTPEEILGMVAFHYGLIDRRQPVAPRDLLPCFRQAFRKRP